MNKWLRSFFAVVAISVPVLAVSGEALAGKGGKSKGTPTSVEAKFSKWMLTPHGTIGGIVLENGTVIRVHEDAVRDTSLEAGDTIHVDAQAKGTVFFKAKITKAGKVVVEDDKKHAPGSKGGDKKKHDASKLSAVSVSGTVANVIPGHKGKVNAIMLSDGTAAYAPHGKDATDLGSFGLKKGDTVTVTGKGGTYPLGKALVIESIKLPSGDVKKL